MVSRILADWTFCESMILVLVTRQGEKPMRTTFWNPWYLSTPKGSSQSSWAFLGVRATWGRKYQRSPPPPGAEDCAVLSHSPGTSRAGGQTPPDTVKHEGEQVGRSLHLPMGPQSEQTHDTKSFYKVKKFEDGITRATWRWEGTPAYSFC